MIPIRDTIPHRQTPFVTWSLIAINVAVFLYELTLDPQDLERLVYNFGVVPARFGASQGGYLTLLTCMFLHGGWAHVIGNMWSLWIFGDNVEDVMGRWRFLTFYLLTGVVAGLTHVFTNAGSNVPVVGASGAIAGVLGAYFVLFPRARIIALLPILFFPFFFEVPAVLYLLFWFLTNLLSGTLSGLGPGNVHGVAFWAHIGGFAAGVVLHRLFLQPKGRRGRRREPDEFGVEDSWAWRPRAEV